MPKPRKLGSYELLERIAVGGMAEIYRARSVGVQGFEKAYVLKLIHPKYIGDQEFIQMLVDEAKLTAQLVHRNIAQVTDLGLAEDQYFVAMEYVEGKDLSQVITATWSRGRPLPTDVVLHVAEQMCAGLYYAHVKTDAQGRPFNLVHRDISPQNVLLSYHGEVKIIDFGVAKAALGARPETRAGIIKGKFRYMSPEQSWGNPLDGRSDLFSVGLCLYEMLTGTSAYKDDGNMHKLLLAMREATIQPLTELRPDIDPALAALVHRALARNRHERYSDAREFQVELAGYLHRRFPGFTPHRISELHQQLFPEAAVALGGAAGGAGALGEQPSDATVQQIGSWPGLADEPTEETVTEGPRAKRGEDEQVGRQAYEDRTLRRGIERVDHPAAPAAAALTASSEETTDQLASEDFPDEITELFNNDRHEMPDETNAMDRDRIGDLLRASTDMTAPPQAPRPTQPPRPAPTERRPPRRAERASSGPVLPGPAGPAGGDALAPSMDLAERAAALRDWAATLRDQAAALIRSESGRKVFWPALGVAIAIFVLLVVALVVF